MRLSRRSVIKQHVLGNAVMRSSISLQGQGYTHQRRTSTIERLTTHAKRGQRCAPANRRMAQRERVYCLAILRARSPNFMASNGQPTTY